jgi:hypothetical protein
LIKLFGLSCLFKALFNLFLFLGKYFFGAFFFFSDLLANLLFLSLLLFDLLEELVELKLLLCVLVVTLSDDSFFLFDLFLEGVVLLDRDKSDESFSCRDGFGSHFKPLGI